MEDCVDLASGLQSAEDGGDGAVCVRPAYAQLLDIRQWRVVQGGARAEEAPGSGGEVVNVLGEVPVLREHDS